MRFSLIFAGFVFIFSPDIILVDFLPDFIGWLLIAAGLSKLADIELRAEDALKLSKRMVFISLAKTVLGFMTFRFNTSDMLLVTFTYAVIELITVIPFATDIFSSFDAVGIRHNLEINSDSLHQAKIALYVFFPLKSLLLMLPATVALFDTGATGDFSANRWFIDYAGLMRVFQAFAFLLAIVVFLVMIFLFVPFSKEIVKNKPFCNTLNAFHRETVMTRPSRMIMKNASAVITLLSSGTVFFFDFYIDGLDMLPTAAGFAAFVAAALLLRFRMKISTTPFLVFSALGLGASLSSFLYRFIPLKNSGFVVDFSFSEKALTLPLSLATALCSAAALVCAVRALSLLNDKCTKYHIEDSFFLYGIAGIIEAAFGFLLYAYPKYNTVFILPASAFGLLFIWLFISLSLKLKKQIVHDNKE